MSPKVRKYIYMLLTPAAALLVFYGVVSEGEAAMWLALAGTALLMGEGGLAAVHTPSNPVEDTKETLGAKLDSILAKIHGDE